MHRHQFHSSASPIPVLLRVNSCVSPLLLHANFAPDISCKVSTCITCSPNPHIFNTCCIPSDSAYLQDVSLSSMATIPISPTFVSPAKSAASNYQVRGPASYHSHFLRSTMLCSNPPLVRTCHQYCDTCTY